jgi:hypothetical protein
VVECIPSKCKAMSSNPSTTKKVEGGVIPSGWAAPGALAHISLRLAPLDTYYVRPNLRDGPGS